MALIDSREVRCEEAILSAIIDVSGPQGQHDIGFRLGFQLGFEVETVIIGRVGVVTSDVSLRERERTAHPGSEWGFGYVLCTYGR